ncbi:MAG: MBL fold metallo-hydrolase [Solirubrobacteraceae bacterium]
MRIQWYGQSAFRLTGADRSAVIDPFGDMSMAAARGMQWDYPPIDGAPADLVLITHEHPDHNDAGVVGGTPPVLRSTAGRLESPLGEVVAIASEHDELAGTQRGPNTIFVFEIDGTRIAHFGDFGQSELRAEQAEAIGSVDLVFLPVGGGPTIGAEQAAAIVARLGPRVVVPMHYRTERIGFLEPADAFVELIDSAELLRASAFELPDHVAGTPHVIVPAAP